MPQTFVIIAKVAVYQCHSIGGHAETKVLLVGENAVHYLDQVIESGDDEIVGHLGCHSIGIVVHMFRPRHLLWREAGGEYPIYSILPARQPTY